MKYRLIVMYNDYCCEYKDFKTYKRALKELKELNKCLIIISYRIFEIKKTKRA